MMGIPEDCYKNVIYVAQYAQVPVMAENNGISKRDSNRWIIIIVMDMALGIALLHVSNNKNTFILSTETTA